MSLLFCGLFSLHFNTSIWQIVIALGTAKLTQYASTRYFHVPSFDPKSALISSLWKNKHVFNPTNLALVVMLSFGLGWISPGQWGQVAWFGFLIAYLGSLVVTRAAWADVTLAFSTFYVGLLFAHAL